MKGFIKFICMCAVAVLLVGLVACQSNGTVKVTFVQEGQEDIVLSVERGGNIENVPDPAPVKGYTVEWNIKKFTNVKNNLKITAVKTPNVYTVTLDETGNGENLTTIDVTFDTVLNLPIPQKDHYVFKGWRIKDTDEYVRSGKYTIDSSITLVAEFSIDDNDDFWSNGY